MGRWLCFLPLKQNFFSHETKISYFSSSFTKFLVENCRVTLFILCTFQIKIFFFWQKVNCICGVMVSTLASNAIDHGFKPWWGQTIDYKIGIYCFSAKHTALRRKNKDWFAWNQNNLSGAKSRSTTVVQWGSTIKIQLSVLV